MTAPGVTRAAIGRGVLWTMAESVLTQAIGLVVFFVIARFVTPAEFGVVVTALLVIDFLRLVLIEGLATALLAKPDADEADYNAAFILSMGIGGACALLILLGAGLIASFLESVELRAALPAFALLFLTSGLARTHEVWLSRHLHFRQLTLRSIVSVALGGAVGVAMAVQGYGLWALVAQQIVASVSAAAMLWLLAPWRPGLKTNANAFTALVRYARHVWLMNATNFVHGQSDTAFTAHFLGTVQTGLYGAGKRIGTIASNIISTPLGRVSTPVFANVQGDMPRLRQAYLEALSLTAALTAPAFAGMAALAPDLVYLMLGSAWQGAAPVVAALALNYFLITVGQYNFSTLLVTGRAHWLSALTAFYAVISLVVLAVAAPFGVTVLAMAVSARTAVLSPISTTLTLRAIDLRWRDYLAAVAVPVVAAVVMALLVGLLAQPLQGLSPLLRLTLLISAGIIAYLAIIGTTKPAIIRSLLTMLQTADPRRGASKGTETI